MVGPPATRLSRRRALRAGSLLTAGLAGCGARVAAPTATGNRPGQFSDAVRRRARDVGERSRPAVVVLQPPTGATSGTAWFLEGGHLVTNAHVVDELGGGPLEGHALDGTRFEVTVERRVETPDLALLAAAVDPPATLSAGRSTALAPGQPLVQVGHVRLGYWTVSLGPFRRRVERDGRTWLLSGLPTMLGNSGSPVLTLDGDVVGLTFGAVPRADAGPSDSPQPGPPTVYETYPRPQVEHAAHLAIETVETHVERWVDHGERT